MSTISLEMPIVSECSVTECAYNLKNGCHARAITIGAGVHPGCDTFFKHAHVRDASQTAGIGACKVTECKHNRDCECMAEGISVGQVGSAATCLTYTS